MTFGADSYKAAAHEHVNAARELYNRQRYALAHYVAGLAVECMLRAYRCRIDSVFDSRHDLHDLARKSGFLDIVPGESDQARKIQACWGLSMANGRATTGIFRRKACVDS